MLCFCDYRAVFSANWDSNAFEYLTTRDEILIYSGASRPRCGPTGSWLSWINIRAASLGSSSMRERSMASHSVRCSIAPFEGNSGCRNTSAPTTIHSTSTSTGGDRNQVHPLRSLSHPFVVEARHPRGPPAIHQNYGVNSTIVMLQGGSVTENGLLTVPSDALTGPTQTPVCD